MSVRAGETSLLRARHQRTDHISTREFDDAKALWAVIDDYLAQAARLDAPPMSGDAIATVMFGQDSEA